MALYSLLNMEQNKRLELSLPVWKTGVLTINTNSANWSWRKDLNLQLIAYKAITLPLSHASVYIYEATNPRSSNGDI